MVLRAQDLAKRLGASRTRVADELAPVLRSAGEPLPDPGETNDFAKAFDRFGSAQVVLLGEATHGTSEFYRAVADGMGLDRPRRAVAGVVLLAPRACDWRDLSS